MAVKRCKACGRRSPDDARALDEFRRSHWGWPGKSKIRSLDAPDPTRGTLTALGPLVSVVYLARKGPEARPPLLEYEHAFTRPLPVLTYTEDGGLVVAGGKYTVTERGIEG